MCGESWISWRQERAREEEGRRLWDLFDRETRTEPPRSVSDDDPEPAVVDPPAPEHAAPR